MHYMYRVLNRKTSAHYTRHCCESTELDVCPGTEAHHREQRGCRHHANEDCAKSCNAEAYEKATSLANYELEENEGIGNDEASKDGQPADIKTSTILKYCSQ